MALTESTMLLELGTAAPDFALPDVVSGQTYTLGSFAAKRGLLVMFICAHCPYVKHIEEALGRISRDYENTSLGIAGICSNDAANYPHDAPAKLAQQAAAFGFRFPYLHDETQQVAKAYHAACTPDFFLFDEQRRLAYRGQFDSSRPGNGIPVTGADLRAAIDAVLAGKAPSGDQRASIGCNIKWKPGSQPGY